MMGKFAKYFWPILGGLIIAVVVGLVMKSLG